MSNLMGSHMQLEYPSRPDLLWEEGWESLADTSPLMACYHWLGANMQAIEDRWVERLQALEERLPVLGPISSPQEQAIEALQS